MNQTEKKILRRHFIQFLMTSPVLLATEKKALAGLLNFQGDGAPVASYFEGLENVEDSLNLFEIREAARKVIRPAPWAWAETGADDEKTLLANREIFDELQIRIRRLISVADIDTSVEIFGNTYASPIMLSPVGIQSVFNPEGEIPVAMAAARQGCGMIAASLSSASYQEINAVSTMPPWFQLYARWPEEWVLNMIRILEAGGCPAIAMTVDTPVGGNRERVARHMASMIQEGPIRVGNFNSIAEGLRPTNMNLNWSYVDWLKANTKIKVLIKGIVTREDAAIALNQKVDGLIVSNHGGRQAETGRSSLESLAEVLEVTRDRIPVLVDGGFRRGTDVFKALALGANAVCIGRPQVWGNGAFGQQGVEKVLSLLQAELIRIMRFAGTVSIPKITRTHLTARPYGAFSRVLNSD